MYCLCIKQCRSIYLKYNIYLRSNKMTKADKLTSAWLPVASCRPHFLHFRHKGWYQFPSDSFFSPVVHTRTKDRNIYLWFLSNKRYRNLYRSQSLSKYLSMKKLKPELSMKWKTKSMLNSPRLIQFIPMSDLSNYFQFSSNKRIKFVHVHVAVT